MRILITGGFGFIGGRLAQHLKDQGHQIILGSRQKNDSKGFPNLEFEVRQTCWDSIPKLRNICSDIDVIIHTAGMCAQDCINDPVGALSSNGLATAKILYAAINQKVPRFIYFSTAHVYNSSLTGVIKETDCTKNYHPYATSHRSGEDVVISAHRENLIHGIVLRLSNGFGVPIHPEVNCWMLLVNNLCRQAVETKKIVLKTSGLQQRNFIPLQEICYAVDFLISKPLHKRHNENESLFNLGSYKSMSVLDMAILVQSRCQLVLDYKPELSCGLPNIKEQNTKLDYKIEAIRKLGYHPIIEPNQEIDSLLIYCNNNFGKTQCLKSK